MPARRKTITRLIRSAIAKRVIDIFLQRHNAAAAIGAIGGDERDCAAVDDAITNAVGAESAEDNRVHRADPRAGQHGNRRLGNVREINDHAIALFDVVPFQHIRETANFVMQLLVGERALVARFAFPDDCRLVSARPAQMPIETILRDVEFAADEPLRERRLSIRALFSTARARPARFASRAQNFAGCRIDSRYIRRY